MTQRTKRKGEEEVFGDFTSSRPIYIHIALLPSRRKYKKKTRHHHHFLCRASQRNDSRSLVAASIFDEGKGRLGEQRHARIKAQSGTP